MYRVLLPVDGDEARAARAAATIVEMPWDEDAVAVTVLNVFREVTLSDEGRGADPEKLFRETEPPASLDVAADALRDAGIEAETRRELGDPPDVILDVAAEVGADHIVMSGRKRTPVGKVLFGSVTQSTLLHAEDVPVTVVID